MFDSSKVRSMPLLSSPRSGRHPHHLLLVAADNSAAQQVESPPIRSAHPHLARSLACHSYCRVLSPSSVTDASVAVVGAVVSRRGGGGGGRERGRAAVTALGLRGSWLRAAVARASAGGPRVPPDTHQTASGRASTASVLGGRLGRGARLASSKDRGCPRAPARPTPMPACATLRPHDPARPPHA